MTAIPDWKLQLLARRRQEEAAVRGREKAERDRLSQMPAWKRGILERRRAKLGLPPGEASSVSGTAEAGPPDPDEPAVLLEAIGPVHQNRFIQQERQRQQELQQRNEMLADRKPGPLEAAERRSSPGNLREQSPKGRESREERLSPRETRDRRLVIGGAQESCSRTLESGDWRQSPAEARDLSSRPAEAQKWRLSPGETPEESLRLASPGDHSPKRKEVSESRLSLGESGDQKACLPEAHKWNLDPKEPQKQSLIQPEAAEWRLNSREERKDYLEESGRKEETLSPGIALDQSPVTKEVQDTASGEVQSAELRSSPAEDGDRISRPTEGWKWTLNSGKARERASRDIETPQKPGPPASPEKHLGQSGVEAEREAETEEAEAQSRPLRAQQNLCSGPSPLPPEHAGAGTEGSRQQEEEAVEPRTPTPAPLSPPPPAPTAPQPPGDPLMSRLFYGVKAGPGVGAPRRSGHTFTVNPRRCVPPASPAPPATPATADAAGPGPGKKRYPTAEEILVLGGYLRLSRSCLAKGSPERHHKQLKISFSETALETTFQYPSESSVLADLGPEPEAPSAPIPLATQPDDDDDEEEEELLLQPGLQGGLRTKALIVDESCRR
ncbi:phostensin [Cricetulus griseus]|uniref:Phostensin n=1 Tax=Cricetulus griseus TaxID=10029 RepID=G3HQQ2_CRIGR|nr:phostensin [Cricetulus griseus]XP_035313905.1 phostensin [Cricetulus griseus]EGW09081.1 Phostensin [Cricetulus griseus]